MKLRGLQSNWDQLGRSDPLWAVLSHPDKRHGGWDLDEFLATGEREIDDALAEADRLGAVAGRNRALDFGCGAGRLTQALGKHFREAVGVDIAPAMIQAAERFNRQGDRCRFMLNTEPHLASFADGSFDLVYSSITLQHIPPRYAARYLNEFLRILAPKGLMVFQLPSGPGEGTAQVKRFVPAGVRTAWGRLRAAVGRPKMQMYWMSRDDIVAALRPWPYRILGVAEDWSAGPDRPSSRYIIERS